MRILGFKPKDLVILSHDEIKKRGEEAFLRNKEKLTGYFLIDNEEKFNKLNQEPLPFSLFRLNELLDYSLNYVGCEISEEKYFERLEVFPPIDFKMDIYSGFIVPECVSGDIFEHVFKHGNKFYCVLMSRKGKKG